MKIIIKSIEYYKKLVCSDNRKKENIKSAKVALNQINDAIVEAQNFVSQYGQKTCLSKLCCAREKE